MQIEQRVVLQLSDDLLSPEWRAKSGRHRYAGHCYVAAEALYHLLGGKKAGWKAVRMKWEGTTHWWIENSDGTRYDPTADQFVTTPDYAAGRGAGFLTRRPSKRTLELLTRYREVYGELPSTLTKIARRKLRGFDRKLDGKRYPMEGLTSLENEI